MTRLTGGDRVSEYLLIEKVGEGGFGEVWKARHHVFERDLVAIKFPTDPSLAAQLKVEGKLQHDLAHPHIVRTLGLDPSADPPYFVMEWVEGKTLRDALREQGRLPFAQAFEVAAQVAEALAYAHAHGVVHHDVKPDNVLVSWSPPFPACPDAEASADWKARTHATLHARVADFGLGRVTQAAARSLLLSGTAATAPAIAGTYIYMAPELKRGVDSGARGDVFALGMLFYEAIVGVPPEGVFREASREASDAPAGLDEFLRRCLAQAPEDRFADAAEALAALRSLAGASVEAPRMELDTPEIDVTDLPCGGDRRVRVMVTNRGHGRLRGEVEVPPGVRWVCPSVNRIDGNQVPVDLCLLADEGEVGHAYATVVTFRTNGGTLLLPVRARVVARPARLLVEERRYFVLSRGRRVTLPIAVENDGDMLLSASTLATVPWIDAPSGDVTIKGARDIEVEVDPEASRAAEESPAEGTVVVRSNGGEATVRVRVVAIPRAYLFSFVVGAALAWLVGLLPGWWESFAWLGLCAGAWVSCHAMPAREWGLTEGFLDAWTRRRHLSWFLAGSVATVAALAAWTARIH